MEIVKETIGKHFKESAFGDKLTLLQVILKLENDTDSSQGSQH